MCLFGGLAVLSLALVIRRVGRTADRLYRYSFGNMMREYEITGLPGAWYFLLGLAVTTYWGKIILELSTIVLSVGDPAASVIGIACQNTRLHYEISQGKSLAGTLGCGISVGVVTSTLLLLEYGAMSVFLRSQVGIIYMGVISAVVAIISEIIPVSRKYWTDDNFIIPVSSAIIFNNIF